MIMVYIMVNVGIRTKKLPFCTISCPCLPRVYTPLKSKGVGGPENAYSSSEHFLMSFNPHPPTRYFNSSHDTMTTVMRYYSSPPILQPSILQSSILPKTTLDYKTAGFGPKAQFSVLNGLYFKTTSNIRPHFLGPKGGLKIEGPLYYNSYAPPPPNIF